MKDIIACYAINQFSFIYKDDKINPDLYLSQINNKDSEISVQVHSNENENKIKNSYFIKCPKYTNIAIVEFYDDY